MSVSTKVLTEPMKSYKSNMSQFVNGWLNFIPLYLSVIACRWSLGIGYGIRQTAYFTQGQFSDRFES